MSDGPTEDQRGTFISKTDKDGKLAKDKNGRYLYNEYDCANCVRYKGGSKV